MSSRPNATERIAEIPAASLKDRLTYVIDDMDPADPMGCAIILIAELGLRANEACGLSWDDIDLDAGVVELRRTYNSDGSTRGLKTGRSRTLDLTPVASYALEKRLAAAPRRRGRAAGPAAPVVCDEKGARVLPLDLAKWWRTARSAFPMHKWTLADLRAARIVAWAREAEAGR